MAHTIASEWGIGADISLHLIRGRRAHSRAMSRYDVTNRQKKVDPPSLWGISLPKIYHR